MTTDININRFECGCVWEWGAKHRFTKTCVDHKNTRDDGCTCLNAGQDDGATTCFEHHDCSDGSCTHQDGDDYPESEDLYD